MKKFILDMLFPIHCLGCGKEGKFICAQCLERIPLNPQEDSPSASRAALVPVKKIIAVADYKNRLVKNAIHRYKYDFAKELSKPLGALMAKKLIASLLFRPSISLPLSFRPSPRAEESLKLSHRFIRDCVLIPVPLHKKRLRWRGFNQSELLCQEISKQLNISIANNILARAKNTPPQAKIKNLSQRESNIQKAFALRYRGQPPLRGLPPINLQNKTVILIDDITTTGATLQQCANALEPLKPKSILGLVLAR